MIGHIVDDFVLGEDLAEESASIVNFLARPLVTRLDSIEHCDRVSDRRRFSVYRQHVDYLLVRYLLQREAVGGWNGRHAIKVVRCTLSAPFNRHRHFGSCKCPAFFRTLEPSLIVSSSSFRAVGRMSRSGCNRCPTVTIAKILLVAVFVSRFLKKEQKGK